jgi:hypothetical protein
MLGWGEAPGRAKTSVFWTPSSWKASPCHNFLKNSWPDNPCNISPQSYCFALPGPYPSGHQVPALRGPARSPLCMALCSLGLPAPVLQATRSPLWQAPAPQVKPLPDLHYAVPYPTGPPGPCLAGLRDSHPTRPPWQACQMAFLPGLNPASPLCHSPHTTGHRRAPNLPRRHSRQDCRLKE